MMLHPVSMKDREASIRAHNRLASISTNSKPSLNCRDDLSWMKQHGVWRREKKCVCVCVKVNVCEYVSNGLGGTAVNHGVSFASIVEWDSGHDGPGPPVHLPSLQEEEGQHRHQHQYGHRQHDRYGDGAWEKNITQIAASLSVCPDQWSLPY